MGNSSSSFGLDDFVVDKSKSQVHEDWTLSPGTLNGNSVIIFSAVHPQSSRKRPFIEKALQCSKIYRHPGILKYLEGGIFGNEIVVATEQATPLLEYGLEEMSPLEITIGLSSIMETLVFLHDKAGVSHNNICPASIFITSEGTWKLWGFEYLCSFGELTRDHMERINQYCYEKAIPPDDNSLISPAYQHARDCFAFSKFIEEFISILMPSGSAQFEELLTLIKEKGLNKDWSQRPRLSKLSENAFFCQEFLQLHRDITNILLLSSDKKEDFIRSLPSSLRKYPEVLVGSTLGALLLSRQILHIPSSATYLMPLLLTPKQKNSDGIFSSEKFKEYLLPHILKLFLIHDATIRKILLSNFENFVLLIPKGTLKKEILPEILLGIRDTDEVLLMDTLKALVLLIPILGADTVIGSNRKRIFATVIPKANSTISNDMRRMKKIKEKLTLPIQSAPQGNPRLTIECDTKSGTVYPPTDNHKATTCEIPERSSPDGGETTDEEISAETSKKESKVEGESWSDWEEMIDKPTPDIVGVLKMMTPEIESVDPLGSTEIQEKDPEVRVSALNGGKSRSSSRSSSNQEDKRQNLAMKLNPKFKGKDVSVKLGEEYTIKSIKVKKKPDFDMDLFADIVPNLDTKAFDLETMLIEANKEVNLREKLPSVSDTLAELDLNEGHEGEGWKEEDSFFVEEEPASPKLNKSFKQDFMINSENIAEVNPKSPSMKIQSEKPDVWDDWD